MDLSENTFFEIHEYLKGNGDAAARIAFERRMQQDPELAREVQSQKRILSGLKANAYKQIFEEIHDQLDSGGLLPGLPHAAGRSGKDAAGSDSRRTWWPYMAAAASLLIALGITWYFHWTPRTRAHMASGVHSVPPAPAAPEQGAPIAEDRGPEQPVQDKPVNKKKTRPASTSEQLFAMYYKTPIGLETPFSRDKYGLSPSAVAQWRADTATLHEGARLLGTGHTEPALLTLKKLEGSRFQSVKYHSGWYIALAFLRLDQMENCREQVTGIAADHANPYHEKAERLLEQLE